MSLCFQVKLIYFCICSELGRETPTKKQFLPTMATVMPRGAHALLEMGNPCPIVRKCIAKYYYLLSKVGSHRCQKHCLQRCGMRLCRFIGQVFRRSLQARPSRHSAAWKGL